MFSDDYNRLLERLNNFIRKYHFNEIRYGLLLLFVVLGISTLAVFLLEYFGHFSVTVRTIIFYFCLLFYVIIIFRYIFFPLFSLFSSAHRLKYNEAADIISKHFPEIQDKFKNTLELADLAKSNRYSYSLLMASIKQKAKMLNPIPFHLAIDYKINYKLLKYLGIIFLVYILLIIFKPIVLKEGSQRMLHYKTEFKTPAPFTFELLNHKLTVEQGDDYELRVKLKGKYIPKRAYVVVGSTRLMLNNIDKSTFTYTFKGVNRSIEFYFEADDVRSNTYRLNVIFPPQIISFKVEITPPSYTGIKASIVENTGDISAPCGSWIKWMFNTSYTDSIIMKIDDSLSFNAKKENNLFVLKKLFLKSANYSLLPINRQMTSNKNMIYSINIIPDMYPSIQVDFVTDSTMWGMYYFKGDISDDYGFTKLLFVLKYNNDSLKQLSIPISSNLLNQEFYFAYDFSALKSFHGNIEYYFEIFDNDGIHGSKSTKSSIKTIHIPDKKELEIMKEEANKYIFNQLNQSERMTSELERELKQLQKNITNSNNISWEHIQKFQQILDKQLQLEQNLKSISEKNKQKNNMLNTFSEHDKEMLEKQMQIQQLLENIMDDELKKLIEKLHELMKNIDKEKMSKITQELKIETEELNKELDRTIEILKKIDIEEKINSLTKELEELSIKQDKLSELVKNKKNTIDTLSEQQQAHKREFEDIQQKYHEIMKQNNQLSEPFNMQSFEQERKSIEQEMQNSENELQNNNRKNASKSQKNASKQLKQLSQQIQEMIQQNIQEAQAEDEENLKMILENIKNLSFVQEELMLKTKQTKTYDPQYAELSQKQNTIQGNIKVIEDSLMALARRNPIINPIIKKHLKNIKGYNKQVLRALENRNIAQATTKQQFIMTEANELALLFDEILKQMQNSNSQTMCTGGKCKKPGSGKLKPNYQQMKNMQQQIKQQLQSIINEMKQGQKIKDSKSISEQLGKMISMQDKMNQMINELMQYGGISPESMKKLQEIKNIMNDVQKDIANKNITTQTIQRQEKILTRLLEAEKADNERDTENKRESKTGKNNKTRNLNEFFQYKYKKSNYDDILFQNNIPLQKYYQELYRKYMINLNK